MNVLIQQLLDLQTLEKERSVLKRQCDQCDVQLSSLDQLKQKAENKLQALLEDLKAREVAYHASEVKLMSSEDSLVQQKAKLLSVKKPEEFSALETSIALLTQKISDLQDQLLEDLDQIEDLRKRCDQAKKETAQETLALCEQAKQVKTNKENATTQMVAKEQEMQAFESKMEGAFYQAYLTLRQCNKALPRVVSVTKDGKCSGCFLTLSTHLVASIATSTTPVFCEHCGRILYRDTDNE